MNRRHFVVAAGGTGGHMVPAHVTAHELAARGHRVTLMTDGRGLRFPGLFGGIDSRIVESAVFAGRNPLNWARALGAVRRGRSEAIAFCRAERVAAVIGFGGYPSLPPLLAATALGRAAILHEQNAVLGRVNRLLSGRAARIATSFAHTQRLDARFAHKTEFTGLPVRADIVALGKRPYPPTDGTIDLLVLGGSQGATILSRVVPAAIGMLSADLRARLRITQQCRPEDLAGVRATYAEQRTPAVLDSYFPDMAARLGVAHLVVARSGASTMAELTVAGRPAILVPFAAATDDHQAANAEAFVAAGGGPMLREVAFTPDAVARAIVSLVTTSGALENAAAAAKSVGRPDAGARLATLAEQLGTFA